MTRIVHFFITLIFTAFLSCNLSAASNTDSTKSTGQEASSIASTKSTGQIAPPIFNKNFTKSDFKQVFKKLYEKNMGSYPRTSEIQAAAELQKVNKCYNF